MMQRTVLLSLVVCLLALMISSPLANAVAVTTTPGTSVGKPPSIQNQPLILGSPKGGESYFEGETVTVKWQGTYPSPHVQVWLLKQNKKIRNLANNLPNTNNAAQFYVSDTYVTGNDYQVLLEGVENKEVQLLSEKFSIFRNSISIKSPQGGEVWLKGNTYKITWNYVGKYSSDAKVHIHLHDNQDIGWFSNTAGKLIAETSLGAEGIGSYSWTIPASLARKNTYRITLSLLGAAIESSKFFTINDIVK